MDASRFSPLRPGTPIPGDWFSGTIPVNIEVGEGTVIDSSACFRSYQAIGECGLRGGAWTTIWHTSLAAGRDATIEIGAYCHLADASLACSSRISIGSYVLIASGATIVDSDFHPFSYADRIEDAVAISPVGDPTARPAFAALPVTIGDGVRIGYNATILKGVTVGANAVIGAGAVVTRHVPSGTVVAGNPARVVDKDINS